MWQNTRKDSEGVRRQRQSARHVQTRMIQVHVGNHAGSSPVIRTSKRQVKLTCLFQLNPTLSGEIQQVG